jgi:hypothetical protein
MIPSQDDRRRACPSARDSHQQLGTLRVWRTHFIPNASALLGWRMPELIPGLRELRMARVAPGQSSSWLQRAASGLAVTPIRSSPAKTWHRPGQG